MAAPVKKVPIHLQSSQNRLLIKNGQIVNEDGMFDNDVFIEDGVIKEIGRNLIIPGGTRVIDARGKLIIPGGIDPHTHFELEFGGAVSVDDFYQGTKAAIAGGTTMIIDFVMPKKGESLLDAYDTWRRKAEDRVCCDYALHVCLTYWSDRLKDEMRMLCTKYGINSFKIFMAYDFMLNDAEIYAAFEQCKALGALPQVHAENGSIIKMNTEKLLASGITGPEGHELSRPEEVEAEATNRACVIAHQVGVPVYLVRVTSPLSVQVMSKKRAEDQIVFGEVTPASLSIVGEPSLMLVTSPPLRSCLDNHAKLMELLASDELQLTGSDNCTFNKDQKALGLKDFSKIPNGVNGVEDRMSVVWEQGVHAGIMDPCRFVAVTSTNAAKIFNVYPRKGCIAVGSDADIVIWDPKILRTISAKTHHQAVDYNIFEGMQCHGAPQYVIVNGRVCLDDGELKVVQGYGRFVETPTFAPFVYDPENAPKLLTKNGVNSEAGDDARSEKSYCSYNREDLVTPTLPNSATSMPSTKGPRMEGQRNLQDSTFSISEDIDGGDRRSCIRVRNPPGGKSSGGFW